MATLLGAWLGDWRDPSATQLAAFAAMVQAAVVIGALGFARGQLAEARAARESTERPFVVIDIDMERVPQIFYLMITNYGRAIARNITFEFEPPLESSWKDGPLPKVLTDGIPTLAPGRSISFSFDSGIERHARQGSEDAPADVVTATIRYQGEKDRKGEPRTYTDPMILDFGMHSGLSYIDRKTVHHVFLELERIRKVVEQMRPSGDRGVLVTTHDEIERRREEWQASLDERAERARERQAARTERLRAEAQADGPPAD